MRALVFALVLLPIPAYAEAARCPPAIVSRYLGETERNLGRLFAEAELVDIVLTFEDADDLFNRRTDTQAPTERSANQELAHLMQRLERFGALEAVASNERRALVAGFNRRTRGGGLVVLETETGARAIEFTRAARDDALAYAIATLEACPPAKP